MELIVCILTFCIHSFISYVMYNESLGKVWHKDYSKLKTSFSERE